jgi:hypothetical protein
MKTYLLFLFVALTTSLIGRSQDVITRKNGDTINAKVLKVKPEEIEYKRHSNLTGASYILPVSDIAYITYENGVKDSFPGSPINAGNKDDGIYTLAERGALDAKMYYGGRRAFIGGAVSAIYPIYGIIPVAIIASTRPRYETLDFPYPELMDNFEYSQAYQRKAFKIKKAKTWEGFGVVTGVWATVLAAVLIGSLTAH